MDEAFRRAPALAPQAISADGPGLELLAYVPPGRPAPDAPANAVAMDWVMLLSFAVRLAVGIRAALARDLDGHRVVLVSGDGAPAGPRPRPPADR